MENLDVLMKTIKDIYRKYTKMTNKQIDNLLKHDLYFDARACVEVGLVDDIYTS